ncbi:MAG: sugar ABC transporter ATP-binding protein [Acidimicrobiaceae bacterium]|nr:sugar ABC transporter ATP-binding protein [Acidimicrobiaceae bacterium]MXW74996.1 sugar ABC transporter ATP-binding protein [Acidimicrobiaceae bacterium]MYA73645.1 sugar ABC transporter ATP-binding protein [Acidimicrobiaceae bacterium]MYC41176.1 sugar ABC transporter ATP-binding protein [Acidimicrobiaceae bacterium]MYD06564.1 sugar ABC transporter ATP-binding protein [Acidimicrobiaceae bacterium]
MNEPALSATNISKAFRAVQALDNVSLSLHHGTVTALLGDNGAGKSTFVKCLAGVYQPDGGTIAIEGTEHRISSPQNARDLGVETVHQALAVIDTLDVTENLFLNREITRGGSLGNRLGILHKRRMRADSEATLARLDIRIPSLRHELGSLSGGQRQAVAIGRAVAWGQKIVLLDEPAAALGVEQTQRVLDLITNLRNDGVAVLLITHNMDRVTAVCDQAVVLYQGRKTAEVAVNDITKDDLVAFITGTRKTI